VDGINAGSLNLLYDQLYAELRAIAVRKMASERPGHTLQPTVLVHEAYLRLGGAERFKSENRAHFFASAAEAMRRILVRIKGQVIDTREIGVQSSRGGLSRGRRPSVVKPSRTARFFGGLLVSDF
jgi:hypothetical protein